MPSPCSRSALYVTAVLVATVAAIAIDGIASAHTTVVFDDAGAGATDISVIGDSTLSGVRWYDDYGDLHQYNFVFDAESCRRTLETSCWSREGYRPENAIGAMQRLSGQLGDVLVMMSGYNDSSYLFDDAVDEVVDEARRQDVDHVLWLTLRAAEDVDYEEPMHQANANTYRESNRVLLDKANEYGGYLQVADWASHSKGHEDWLEADGVHLTADGVDGITTFIAEQVDEVLAGGTITPAAPAWVTLEAGDSGDTVAEAQQALWEAGYTSIGGVDAVFGELTTDAVGEFQAAEGLEVNGTVDTATAIALGLHQPPEPAADPAPYRLPAPAPDAPPVVAVVPVDGSPMVDWWVAGGVAGAALAVVGVALLLRRRRRCSGDDAGVALTYVPAPEITEELAVVERAPYDYELDDVLA